MFQFSAQRRQPRPGVLSTKPRTRGDTSPLKKLLGKKWGSNRASGTPSQLISRRPGPTLTGAC